MPLSFAPPIMAWWTGWKCHFVPAYGSGLSSVNQIVISVPFTTASLSLTVDGTAVDVPYIDADDRLWMSRPRQKPPTLIPDSLRKTAFEFRFP